MQLVLLFSSLVRVVLFELFESAAGIRKSVYSLYLSVSSSVRTIHAKSGSRIRQRGGDWTKRRVELVLL